MSKQCPKCKETKSLSDFASDPRTKLKVSSYCLICKRKLHKKWLKKKLIEQPNYYRNIYRNNPEAARNRVHNYRERHKERLNKERREKYAENPQYDLTIHKNWYLKNRQELRVKNWLNGHDWYGRKNKRPIGGYLKTQGICLFCGELNPLLLQNAHIFKDNHNLLISLCCNCHWLLDRYPFGLHL